MNLIILILGGALGSVCRYVLGIYIMKKWHQSPLPVAIIFINCLGSLGLGISIAFFATSLKTVEYESVILLFWAVGFFGAFTTFSTFSMEAIGLIQSNQLYKAFLYVVLTFLGCFVLFMSGYYSVLFLTLYKS